MAISSKPDRVEIDPDVARNYFELHQQGREWDSMADEAERMNDHKLAAHLRQQADDAKRDDAPKDRKTAAERKDATA
jgi:hypothetical protein